MDVAPLWLGVLGAVTGIIGLLTAVASAIYTRRAALAAEGPRYPGIEVSSHGWDGQHAGWYSLSFVVRNRTSEPWEVSYAKAGGLFAEPLFSNYSMPYTGEDFNPVMTPLNDLPENRLPKSVLLGLSAGPIGTKHFHGHGGDVVHFSILLRPSAFSRFTKRVFVSLSLEAKTERVRHKDIAVTRRLKPRIKTPA